MRQPVGSALMFALAGSLACQGGAKAPLPDATTRTAARGAADDHGAEGHPHVGKGGADHAQAGEHEIGSSATPSDARGSGHSLRVDPSMLRDLRMTTATVEVRPAGDAVSALGELRVNEDAYAEVGSPLPARVARVHAAPGDRVRAGQPLVTLESAEVGRARSALISAEARVELARRTASRRKELANERIVPAREVETANAELLQAQADLKGARQALAVVGASRGEGATFVLVSPVAGTVIERNALRGRLVDAEKSIFIVGDLRRLWLVAHAFERDAVRIRTGVTARVSFPALPGQRFEGRVTRTGGRVDPASRTVEIRVELDNPSGVLRPGMSASASIPVGEASSQVVTVPVAALQRLPAGWSVFLPQKEEGLFEVRGVGRGRDLAGEVEILRGLSAGERVVVDGAFLLKAEADKARGGGADHDHH